MNSDIRFHRGLQRLELNSAHFDTNMGFRNDAYSAHFDTNMGFQMMLKSIVGYFCVGFSMRRRYLMTSYKLSSGAVSFELMGRPLSKTCAPFPSSNFLGCFDRLRHS